MNQPAITKLKAILADSTDESLKVRAGELLLGWRIEPTNVTVSQMEALLNSADESIAVRAAELLLGFDGSTPEEAPEGDQDIAD